MGKVYGIVLAAGKGSRMKSDIQKQFMMLGEYPVLYYSLKIFCESEVDEVVLVTGADDIEYCEKEICQKYNFDKVTHIVPGGSERFESVRNALSATQDADYVVIHDGARPLVTKDMISRSLLAVKSANACTVAVPVKDTIKQVDEEGYGIATPDRKYLWQIQTPQTFNAELIKESYVKLTEAQDNAVTDDTMVVEKYSGVKSMVIEGDYTNIKITTPEDIAIAEMFLERAK